MNTKEYCIATATAHCHHKCGFMYRPGGAECDLSLGSPCEEVGPGGAECDFSLGSFEVVDH